MRHYVGAASAGRFLLIRISSPADADALIDSSRCGELYARDSETGFFKSGCTVVAQPRAQRRPSRDASFGAMESFLRYCLRLFFPAFEPGTLRWEGDNFVGESPAVAAPTQQSVRVVTRDGRTLSERETLQVLAQLQAHPEQAVHSSSRVFFPSARGTGSQPPGIHIGPAATETDLAAVRESVEGCILRAEGDRLKGFLVRAALPYRFEFHYTASPELESPFPNRAVLYMNATDASSGTPQAQLLIHHVRLSDGPANESLFNPWPRLKRQSFARGTIRPNGRIDVQDRKDQLLLNSRAQARIKASIASRSKRWFMLLLGAVFCAPLGMWALRKPKTSNSTGENV